MPRALRWSVAVILVTAGWVAVAAAQEATTPTAATARVRVETRVWDFGTLWQGMPAKTRIKIENVGQAPLTIDGVKSSCGCTTPSKPDSPLAPGAATYIEIRYDTVQKLGEAHQAVSFNTNDPDQASVALQVRGTVKPIYEVKPTNYLVFGRLYQSAAETRELEITNKYDQPLELKLAPDQDFGSFDVELKTVEPGQRYVLRAKTRPPLPIGINRTEVRANAVIETNVPFLPQIRFLAYGFVPPEVEVVGAPAWPRTSVMEFRQTVYLRFAPDRPLKVLGVETSDPAIQARVEDVPESDVASRTRGQFKVTIIMPPGDRLPAGHKPVVTILTNSDNPAYKRVEIPIRVIGDKPAPEVAPAAGDRVPRPKAPHAEE